jgi:diguanylate cyclase (GGDEF)-like protein
MYRNRWLFTWGHLIIPINLFIDLGGRPFNSSILFVAALYLLWSLLLVLFYKYPKLLPLHRQRRTFLKAYILVDLVLLALLLRISSETGIYAPWLYVALLLLYAVEFGFKVSLVFGFAILLLALPFQWVRFGGWSYDLFKEMSSMTMIQLLSVIVVGTVTDRLHRQAYYDPLTRTPNRTYMKEMLIRSMQTAEAKKERMAVYFLDLDRFKNLNDTMGHDAGDELLRQTAERLSLVLPKEVILGRLGGDEFIVLWAQDITDTEALQLGDKMVNALHQPFTIDGKSLHITTSVGVSIYPDHGGDAATLMKHADAAMYRAKITKNRCEMFHDASVRALQEKFGLETDLAQALKNKEMRLFYQPKVDIRSGLISGMEVLLRWEHPVKGMISPADFIPIAEEQGYIIPIGEWVLEEACRQVMEWSRTADYKGSVSVNLSVYQFYEPSFLGALGRILQETGFPPQRLDLEITESMAMQDSDYTVHLLHSLNRLGVTISIDDFGTGYSSLSYLARYPIHSLKIDRSFVKDMSVSPSHSKIVKSIIHMANSLKLRTVAEGVESWEQFEALKRMGCAEAQGYLFSRPVAANEMPALLGAKRIKLNKNTSGSAS